MKDSGDRLKEVAATSLLLRGSEPLADPIQLQGAAQVVWWEATFLQINDIQLRLTSITLRHTGIGMQKTAAQDIQISEITPSQFASKICNTPLCNMRHNSSGFQLVAFWLYFYIKVRLQKPYVILQLNCHSGTTTSLFSVSAL